MPGTSTPTGPQVDDFDVIAPFREAVARLTSGHFSDPSPRPDPIPHVRRTGVRQDECAIAQRFRYTRCVSLDRRNVVRYGMDHPPNHYSIDSELPEPSQTRRSEWSPMYSPRRHWRSVLMTGAWLTAMLFAPELLAQANKFLPKDEGRHFADERIIWNDPLRPGTSPAFIPKIVLDRVALEDLPLLSPYREDLMLQAEFRQSGRGHGDRPYPVCGAPRHFQLEPAKKEHQRILEEIALEWEPSILVGRIVAQEEGWNILHGALVLNTVRISETLQGNEGLLTAMTIRFASNGADFTAAGIRWCSKVFPGAYSPQLDDDVLLIGSNTPASGIFNHERYFRVREGVIELQPYSDIRDNRARPLAEFVDLVRRARENP